MEDFFAQIVAYAILTRYERGEGTLEELVAFYKLSPADAEKVLGEVYKIRPELKPAEEEPAG